MPMLRCDWCRGRVNACSSPWPPPPFSPWPPPPPPPPPPSPPWPPPAAADNNHFKSSCKLYPGHILYDYTQMLEICMLSGVLGLPKYQILIFLELNVLRPLASIFIKENAFYSDYQFPIPITIYCSIFLLPVVDGVQYNDESLLLISFPGLHTNPSQEQGHLQGFREAPTNN